MGIASPTRLFFLAGLVFALTACGEESLSPATTSDAQALSSKTWLRLETPNPGKLRALLQAEGLDITGSNHRQGFVDVVIPVSEKTARLSKVKYLITNSRELAWPKRDKALSDYHDPAEIEAFMDNVVAAYPDIAKKVLLTSGLPEGGTIWAMKISDNVDLDEDEPTYLMDGQMHAREVMAAEVMMDAIDHLTRRYATDSQVRRWVDEMEIWIVPVVNPDGATYVHNTQPMWRKNRSHECDPFPGVDLNRNFAWKYRACAGSDDNCSSDVYHGPSAASEIETQTMQALMQELRSMYYINYHTYGEYILWSSGCGAVDEEELLRSVGEELNDLVRTDDGLTGQWSIGPSGDVFYTAPGGSDDFAYGASGAVAFTFELNAGSFQPDYNTWRDLTVTHQRAAWGHLLDRTLDGPSLRGHTFDAQSGAPVVANYRFVDHPFSSGQWALETDAHGRFGRANLPQRSERLVFTAPGYLPELREVQVDEGPVDLEVPMHAGINQAPTAQISAPALVNEGDEILLDGSGSTDPDGNAIFHAWRQTSGPEVYLDNPLGAQPQFIAPAVDADTDLIFELIVDDGELLSNPQTTTVRVRDMWDDLEILNALDTPQNIPDNDPAGILSVIHVSTYRRVLRARVQVDITHTYIGELTVSLKSPAQTLVLLHDMVGGSSNNIHEEYLVPQVVGEMSAGDWTLEIIDHGFSDLGRLDGWQLTLDLEGGTDCQTAADCELFSVAEAACTDGRCEIVRCLAPWLDCNLSTHDGCEADPRTDLAHCGGCDQACSYPHGLGLCQDSSCLLVDCLGDYEDCNEDERDGCEVWLTADPLHCGSCTLVCGFQNANALCRSGICRLGTCHELFGNCDEEEDNGCEENLSSNPNRCGDCNLICDLAHAQAICMEGICQVEACEPGWGDCDQLSPNGCEADFANSSLHCGGCGLPCEQPNTVSRCEAGTCQIDACIGSFRDCNQVAADGCEADMISDPANCGRCGHDCNLPQTQVACEDRICVVLGCDSDFGDCNNQPEDGCEQDLLSSLAHCGGCNTNCQPEHAEAICLEGQCEIDHCDAGWGDCNLNTPDGCETDLNQNNQHCGACGTICPRGSTCIHGLCGGDCMDADKDNHFAAICGGDDCNDHDAAVHPGADEICNGVDDDCDGLVDEGCPDDGGGEGCGCASAHDSNSPYLALLGMAFLGLVNRNRKRQYP